VPSGIVSNQLSSTIDILPTIAGITKASLPQRKIDGVDLTPILRGDLSASPRKTFYYYYRKNSLEAVRFDNWKLVFEHPSRSYRNQAPGFDRFPGKAPENGMVEEALYDLRRDPGEQYDVKAYYPEMVSKLKSIADEAREDLGDDIQKVTGKNNREVGKLSN
jgi:arylsulfatase